MPFLPNFGWERLRFSTGKPILLVLVPSFVGEA
jgi:hypothetical protein